MYDVIVIGKGPAGITAAIYAKRAGLNVIVIGKDSGSLEKSDMIENYYGFEKPISGVALEENGEKQAANLGIEIICDEVIYIDYNSKYIVSTTGKKYEAKSVVIATGARRKTPIIEGIMEFEGKGVSYCAVCDAFFYRGKDVVVIGNGVYALHELEVLAKVAKSVTLLTNGQELIEYRNNEINIIEKDIDKIGGENTVSEIQFKDGSKIKTDGVFIAQGVVSSVDLARRLGVVIDNNHICVNSNMETNLKGLYACGDCTGGILQISKAVYEGTVAGLQVAKLFV